jgi:phosphatidylinositol alpha-1,6-mannosyltransferase
MLAKIYASVNIPSLKKLDKLFMVGNHTIDEAVKIGIAREQCVFIPNGINIDELVVPASRTDMEKILGIDLSNKKVILRIARFVPHKGVEWFIRNVMPKLPENYFFVAVGGIVSNNAAGNENVFPACEKAIAELGLEKRAQVIGDIPERDKLILLNCADLYISPNIQVPGSMEGFGITAIEAGACGRVVLASDLEGLKDAIHEGQNGFLVEPANAEAYVKKINELLSDDDFREKFGKKAQQFVIDNFSWEGISKNYLAEIEKVVNAKK